MPIDHASRLEAQGFDVVSIPGASHSVHYSHFDEVVAVLAGPMEVGAAQVHRPRG